MLADHSLTALMVIGSPLPSKLNGGNGLAENCSSSFRRSSKVPPEMRVVIIGLMIL